MTRHHAHQGKHRKYDYISRRDRLISRLAYLIGLALFACFWWLLYWPGR